MIAVIVALDNERDAIVQLLENKEEISDKMGKYIKGYIGNKEILVAMCGVGKVAAAISVCALLENYPIELVINLGTAGGLKEQEEIGDVLIADKLTYYDWDTSGCDNIEPSFETNDYVFETDKTLIEKARNILDDVDHQVFIAPIVSGDCFVSSKEKVDYIQKYFPQAYGCEMEATSVAHACSRYNIPFLIIRSFSDIVNKENNGMDYTAYKYLASRRAAEFMKKYCQQ